MIKTIYSRCSQSLALRSAYAGRASLRQLHGSALMFASAKPSLDSKPEDEKVVIKIEPLPRLNESLDKKRARLLWQSRKRGILETCVLLGKFAQEYLPTLTEQELKDYDEFMNENDWDIYYWITETPNAPTPCPEHWKSKSIFEKLKKIGRNENNEIMRQPNLY